MSYGELSLPPVRPERNAVTGRYMKGHTPTNKGKKWSEYLSKTAQQRCSKGWENLSKYRRSGLKHPEKFRKPIIAVSHDSTFRMFTHAAAAIQWLGRGNIYNVQRCCRCNEDGKNTEHAYLGVRFYYESNEIWLTKIKQ